MVVVQESQAMPSGWTERPQHIRMRVVGEMQVWILRPTVAVDTEKDGNGSLRPILSS